MVKQCFPARHHNLLCTKFFKDSSNPSISFFSKLPEVFIILPYVTHNTTAITGTVWH